MELTTLALLLAQIAAILLVSRALGLVTRWLGQPMVIAEMLAGIALGPSLLGLLLPHVFETLFPAASLGVLKTLSQLGLVLFMFLVGLELDPALLRGRRAASIAISHLLPLFFAYSGIRTRLGLVSGADWLVVAGIIALATLGKFGGSAVAARVTGLRWREASAIGVLMNTRGLMELIVLNVGMDLGVITPTLFTMLVLMALVTTFATTPILHWVYPDRELLRETDAAVLLTRTVP